MANATAYDSTFEIYGALISEFPEVQLKGKKIPYTSMNGNMFSFLSPEGLLCIRIGDKQSAIFNQTHGTGPVVQHGRVMKEYVQVPEHLLHSPGELRQLFGACLEYARTLKPKATKR